jgi:hypothetical protein
VSWSRGSLELEVSAISELEVSAISGWEINLKFCRKFNGNLDVSRGLTSIIGPNRL